MTKKELENFFCPNSQEDVHSISYTINKKEKLNKT